MATTAGASAAIRKVFQLLEDNFEVQEGRYKNGYSDERIAKETGLSITAIHDHLCQAQRQGVDQHPD